MDTLGEKYRPLTRVALLSTLFENSDEWQCMNLKYLVYGARGAIIEVWIVADLR